MRVHAVAAAVDPASLKIAMDVGFAIAGLFSRSGGSVANLIRAQTEMLVAMSAKLDIINEKIDEMYRRLDDIKEALDKIPTDTVRTWYSKTIHGYLTMTMGEMGRFADNQETHGRQHALNMARHDCRLLRYNIKVARNVLMQEDTVAVIPAVCSAWFAEQQLALMLLDFDPVEIRHTVAEYKKYLEFWRNRLDEKIIDQERRAGVYAEVLSSISENLHQACYTNIRAKVWHPWSSEGHMTKRTLSAEYHSLSAVPHGIVNPTSYFRPPSLFKARFEELRAEGVDVSAYFDEFWAYDWTYSGKPYSRTWGPFHTGSKEDGKAAEQHQGLVWRFNERACGKADELQQDAQAYNSVTRNADLLQSSTITNYSFRLAAIATLASIEATAEAVRGV